MRVITGTARGRVLRTLEGEDVRPTTDRVKEAVFSIIQFEIEGRRVLDLFAGSGQLGIEALSRGAASATFVDMSKDSLSAVKYNLEHTKLGDNAKVVQTDALSFLKLTKDKFDIVFLDPPYASSLVVDSMKLLSDVVAAGGCAICETPVDSEGSSSGTNLSALGLCPNPFGSPRVVISGRSFLTTDIHQSIHNTSA